MNSINMLPAKLSDLIIMKPSSSLLFLVSVASLFLFSGECYVCIDNYILIGILELAGKWRQSWCDIVVYNDDAEGDKEG